MGIAVLVIFWVVVGILVVGVAMSATKKPNDEEGRSRVGTAVFGLGVAVLIVVGLAVLPAWILVDNTDADAKTVGGVHLNDAQVHGRELFAANCAQCHTLRASNAIGETGPNLDTLRPKAALVLDAIKNGRARGGMGQMPAGLLAGDDAKDVASYVQAVAGR
ncbi:MAG: c-type cytochrome [Solirubrobacterales bacterium]|nr:c-type cytochrome [Solirubrobacterales bacterium]